jgi:uncharacterized protein (TIGR00661 family)
MDWISGIKQMLFHRLSLFFVAFLNLFFFCCLAETPSSLSAQNWLLGGNLVVKFQSDTPFRITEKDRDQFAAHLPGFQEQLVEKDVKLKIEHIHSSSGPLRLTQSEGKLDIVSQWKDKFPPDFIHLLYGAARVEWLKQGIFPVHAACIGNEKEGYVLLMGPPGSGKTSLTLASATKHGFKVFSGDKTLLRFKDNQLEAIAGTHTLTIRSEDVQNWTSVPKMNEQPFGDRLAFQLPSEFYSEKSSVPIKKVFLVNLNEGLDVVTQLSPTSALHTLYPFFMDKQREDVLIEGDQAFFDGSVDKELRVNLAKELKAVLETVPVYKIVAPLNKASAFISDKVSDSQLRTSKKIVFGICGIGNGHINRQLPIIRHFIDKGDQILIFTYGEGMTFFSQHFPSSKQLTVIPVANPYYVGNPQGLDFEQTALSEKNKVDFNRINALAMKKANEEFGKPDLVISDYEMVAAQYAYIKNAPLVTLDQQSKYLVGDFNPSLNGTSYQDEIERLNLFFPKAEKRIAVSFFKVVDGHHRKDLKVEIFSPMIRPEVIQAQGHPQSPKRTLLVYITAQQLGEQPIEEWIATIRSVLSDNDEVHLFLPRRLELMPNEPQLFFYHHGDSRFDALLFASHGIITTAGHTLLSEAMFLEKPVFALPLPLYEQQLNADIIDKGGFGMSGENLTADKLRLFLNNLSFYSKNIHNDTQWLLKEPGNIKIIEEIEEILEKND